MTPPAILYKFVGPSRLDVLRDKRIRFTPACALNDPFEFRCGAPVPEGEGIGHFEQKIHEKVERENLRDSQSFGVLSLAEEWDSIPMWSHYADSHKGFVIAFNTKSEWLESAWRDDKLKDVNYVKERICTTRRSKTDPGLRSGDVLRTKSIQWEYEHEWRWIECSPSHKDADDQKVQFLRPFPAESISEIILGYRSSIIELVDPIRKIIKETPDYAHVRLRQVALHANEYKLEAKDL